MNIVPATFEDAKLLDKCPCDFKKARFMQPLCKGYWVTLYCLFDGKSVYWFFHQPEAMENASIAYETGVSVTSFIEKVLVTPTQHTEIFNMIEDYVSRSDKD